MTDTWDFKTVGRWKTGLFNKWLWENRKFIQKKKVKTYKNIFQIALTS